MDFSRIPFHSAVSRLGHLLPIRAFVRLESVEPFIRNEFPKRFYQIMLSNKASDGPVKFYEGHGSPFQENQNTDNSPEAMLNPGPIECRILHLLRTDEIPPEAITCTEILVLQVTDESVIPFLDNPVQSIKFLDSQTTDCSPTVLGEIVANLRLEVQFLDISWSSFVHADDFTNFKLTRRQEVPIKMFRMEMPDPNALLKWLRHNSGFLAKGKFCKEAVIFSQNEDVKKKGWEAKLKRAVRPFCQHETESGVYLRINWFWHFYIDPERVCACKQ